MRERKNMKLRTNCAAIAAIITVTQAVNAGDLGDLYVTSASGMLYEVDGGTLQATGIAQLSNAGTINDLEYLGNGQIAANLTFAVAVYDINTSTQTTLFSTPEIFNNPGGIQYTSGLTQLSNGELYMSTINANPDATVYESYSYNFQSGNFTQYADAPSNLPFDHHQLDDGTMLTIDQSDVYLHELNSGAIINSFNTGLYGVSLFESNNQLYLMTNEAEIHSLDISNGNTSYVGTISGISGTAIGATIPAPSGLALFGMVAVLSSKRRR
jgi:hypothetical protein